MSNTVHNINQKYVPVLNGAADVLVTHRELRTKYCTNRSIKTWATYFLLKALTTSGQIQNWNKQKLQLLSWCKMNDNSFRSRLKELVQLKLATVSGSRILLTSYESAAEILGIDYEGTTKIPYDENLPGKQIFQYFIRAEEIRNNQQKQQNALWYHLGKNPLLKQNILLAMQQFGCEDKRIYEDPVYFQQQLLMMQQKCFADGSATWELISAMRADINRSVTTISKHHKYKSAQSVTYMKRKMFQYGIIAIEKLCIESDQRTRLYIADGERKRDGYRYIANTKKTAWFLTDQISFKYKSVQPKKNAEKKQAA